MMKRQRAVLLLIVLTCIIGIPGMEGKSEWWSDIDWSEDTWTQPDTEYETERKREDAGEEHETEEMTEYMTEVTTEQESEQEDDKIIRISNLQMMYENGQKVYDGTCDVNLIFSVEKLPENLILKVSGRTEKSDVGCYPVMIEASLSGEGAEDYAILAEKADLMLEIIPKPLKITIADARRPYYRKNALEELFFDEIDRIKVEGFVLDSEKRPVVPADFRLPEMAIDERIVEQRSPMYRNGEEYCYDGALTVARNSEGAVSGNPGKNYIFLPEDDEYCKKGNIWITAPYIEEGKDYEIRTQGTMYRDEAGSLWVSYGDILHVIPENHCGFSEGITIGPLYEGGVQEFTLKERNKAGGILAESQIRSVAWNVDGAAPEGSIMIGGTPDDGESFYTSGEVPVQILATDRGSGLKSLCTYVAEGEECGYDPAVFYRESGSLWEERSSWELSEEGRFSIFARLEDQVGNETFLKSKWIIVDKTPPQLVIENVTDGSANRGTVMPIIQASDENIGTEAIHFELTGFQSGKRKADFKRENAEKEETVMLQDFLHAKDWDDVYQLEATAEDLAGNRTETKIQFSANRFGSTYYIEDALAEKLKGYYLKEPVDIVIHEWNVDELVEEQILMGCEEDISYLEEGTDYTVTVLGDDRSIKEYIYRISAEHFRKNGHYYIVFSSKDEAENYSDNRTEKKNVEFAVDSQAPVMVVLGVKDGESYDTEMKVSFECIENMELSKVSILVDGKEAGDGKSTSQEILLKEKDGWQSIRTFAVDAAGNESQVAQMKVWIGEKRELREDIEEKTNTENGDTSEGSAGKIQRKTTGNGEDNKNQPDAEISHPIQKILYFMGFLAFLKGILLFVRRVDG